MKNGILTLDWGSIADAVLTAAITAALVGFVSVVGTNGFDLFTAPWVQILHNMANLGFIAAVISLGQDLLSTNNGSLLNITPSNKLSM